MCSYTRVILQLPCRSVFLFTLFVKKWCAPERLRSDSVRSGQLIIYSRALGRVRYTSLCRVAAGRQAARPAFFSSNRQKPPGRNETGNACMPRLIEFACSGRGGGASAAVCRCRKRERLPLEKEKRGDRRLICSEPSTNLFLRVRGKTYPRVQKERGELLHTKDSFVRN